MKITKQDLENYSPYDFYYRDLLNVDVEVAQTNSEESLLAYYYLCGPSYKNRIFLHIGGSFIFDYHGANFEFGCYKDNVLRIVRDGKGLIHKL